MGGDGTFNEVMHALIDRTQQKAGKLQEDWDTELLSPRLRIGIIPAGKDSSSPKLRHEAFFKSWEITTKTLIQGSGWEADSLLSYFPASRVIGCVLCLLQVLQIVSALQPWEQMTPSPLLCTSL